MNENLKHNINWEEKAKIAYEAYAQARLEDQPQNKKAVQWEKLPSIERYAFVASIKAFADSMDIRWTDTGILVTAAE